MLKEPAIKDLATSQGTITEKRPKGRPTSYMPKFCDQLISLMAEGYSFTAAMAAIGVSRQTGYSWVKQHEDFSQSFKLAKGKRLLFLELRLLSATSAADAMSTIFALKNADPTEWRDRRELQHGRADGNSIQIVVG